MSDLPITDHTMLDLLAGTVDRYGDSPAIHSFGTTLTWNEADELASRIAAGLSARNVTETDRVGLLMQNMPQYMLSLMAIWKLGATAVPINPMLLASDIRFILNDSGASALIGLDTLVAPLLSDGGPFSSVPLIITTAADEYSRDWPASWPITDSSQSSTAGGTVHWTDLVRSTTDGWAPAAVTPEMPAVVTYTSGTTGPPKGAINTHFNVVFASRFYESWVELDQRDVILGIAPLFHITGLVAYMGPSIATGASLVLGFRFDPSVIAGLIEQYRPTFTLGAITAFISLMTHEGIGRCDTSSLTKVYSGGAPIAPTTVEDFQRVVGPYIHNIYGLTEATGPCLAVPLGARAPVDPVSGALAAGIPVHNTEVKIVRADGTLAATGQDGELAMRGPQVIPGYWQRDTESEHAIRDGWLYTGDVAVMDADGWFYIVDRLKDQINASGFKVWPREVEDALVAHPDVIEAAVVGVADSYRGETVKGFVVLLAGSTATPTDIIAFSRERLAAYKYPRSVEIVDELPKTASGKTLRRALR